MLSSINVAAKQTDVELTANDGTDALEFIIKVTKLQSQTSHLQVISNSSGQCNYEVR